MRLTRLICIPAVLLAALALSSATQAEGLFDFLFGPDPSPGPQGGPPAPYGRLHAPRGHTPAADAKRDAKTSKDAARDGASGPPHAAEAVADGFCVRTCDGYYFPLIKSSRATRQQSCEFLCPSAPVEIYEGSSIEQARNAKGQRYSALPTAFSFRDKTTQQCACNDPQSSQRFFQSTAWTDPTLRSGDVVIEDKGALVYNGSNLVTLGRASFVPSQIRERLRAIIHRNATLRPPREEPAAEAKGSIEFSDADRESTHAPAPH